VYPSGLRIAPVRLNQVTGSFLNVRCTGELASDGRLAIDDDTVLFNTTRITPMTNDVRIEQRTAEDTELSLT
jgi:hypothetical protein